MNGGSASIMSIVFKERQSVVPVGVKRRYTRRFNQVIYNFRIQSYPYD